MFHFLWHAENGAKQIKVILEDQRSIKYDIGLCQLLCGLDKRSVIVEEFLDLTFQNIYVIFGWNKIHCGKGRNYVCGFSFVFKTCVVGELSIVA